MKKEIIDNKIELKKSTFGILEEEKTKIKNLDSHRGQISHIFNKFNKKLKICEICDNTRVKPSESHSLQNSALNKILTLNSFSSKDKLCEICIIGNASFNILSDIQNKTISNILKNTKNCNTFYNICEKCEKTEPYEDRINDNDSNINDFTDYDIKTIFEKGILSKKYIIDREIYLRKEIKKIKQSSNLNEKKALKYFTNEINLSTKELLNNSNYLKQILKKTKNKNPVILFENFINNNQYFFNFGCLTSRIFSIEKSLAPVVLYVSPYKHGTKILILGTKTTENLINRDNSFFLTKTKDDWMLNLIKLLALDYMTGISIVETEKLGKILSLSFEIQKQIMSPSNNEELKSNELSIEMFDLLKN